jgi:formylglycine-generating enzyme required for sulfatase activity
MIVGVLLMSPVQRHSSAADDDADQAELKQKQLDLLRVFVSEFVEITPGRGKFPRSFQMGSADGPRSERPVRTVMFDYDFAMARYEVPQNLYEAVTGKNPSVWGGPRNSVEMMTWREAEAFCREATRLLREAELIGPNEVVRLPTEAEWEYCCRAGTTTAYSFGDSATAPDDRGNRASLLDPWGWHTGNAAGNDPPVGAKKPNPWGLYDMHGYLWEYVADAWHEDYSRAPVDGSAREADRPGTQRVMRGGSWRDHHSHLKSTTRWAVPDHVRSDAIGFRCVKATEK